MSLDGQFEHTGYVSVTQMLEQHASAFSNEVAIRQKKFGIWQEMTWLQYFEETQLIAAGLLSIGIEPGAHLGIVAENCQEWIMAQLGSNFANTVPCGVYPTSPANEVLYLLTSAECSLVFCEDQEQVDKLLEIRDQLPLVKKIVVFDDKGLKNYQEPDLMTLDALMALGKTFLEQHPHAVAERHALQVPNDTALVVFTSGSTGLPKAAMISFENMWHQMKLLWDTVPAEMHQDILSYLPLCHIAEQAFSVLNAIARRMTVNFGESLRTIRTDLQEIAPQMFFGVPRVWEKMQAEIVVLTSRSGGIRQWLIKAAMASAQARGEQSPDDWSLSERIRFQLWYWTIYRYLLNYLGLRKCEIAMTAAAPISPHLLAQFRGMGVPLVEIFGMTETTGAATVQPFNFKCAGRIGKPGIGVECKIAEDGELLVKSGIIFKGYYKNPEATANTIQDGWLHTGDIATAFEDGSYSIVDRKKDIIINAAGKNLSPSLIENTMKASPYIKECICIGDQQRYVVALIQIDYDTVTTWAESKQISYTTFKSLSENADVVALIEEEVATGNKRLARVEQIKKFVLLTKELDHDDGEVTATMKIRRSIIAKQYAAQIEALYEDKQIA
jgi:long-chain acyl-CoA synthetase